ncbi:MAG: chromate transporter [Burkholderiales bacterium]|nr:chromate transporter [Burkholderiales bacterium]
MSQEAGSEAARVEEPTASPPGPQSLSDLFWTFNRLSLQGFGGVLAVAQRELVERKQWISHQQFLELLSVSQVLPGPNVVNLSLMIGDRHFGLRGAFVALGGMLAIPLVIVLAVTALYAQYASLPMVSGALRGMGAVAAGLVIATALKLATTLRSGAMGVPLSAIFGLLTFIAIALLRWPLVWVLLGLGPVAVAIAWRRIKP